MNIRPEHKYGSWVLIIGSAEGLGEAFSVWFAERGFNLVMVDHQEQKLRELVGKLERRHLIETMSIVQDLADPHAPEVIFEKVRDLDCGMLVYVAAKSIIAPFLQLEAKEMDCFINVNCRNPLMLSFMFAEKLKTSGGGGIVLMSSLSGLLGMRLVPVYAATKAFNWNLAEGLSHELKPYHIDVMSVIAGTISTPAYQASNPAKSLFVPPALKPDLVVKASMKHFGSKTLFIPGLQNRISYFILLRLLPRKLASKLANRSMMKLYPLKPVKKAVKSRS